MLCGAVRSKQQCYLVSWLEHVLCVQGKTCKIFLPLYVNTQVINLLNGIWRHQLLSNKSGQNSCSLIVENNHCKCSVICVRLMYKYFFSFLILLRLSFLKTFLVLFCDFLINNIFFCPRLKNLNQIWFKLLFSFYFLTFSFFFLDKLLMFHL